MSVSKRSEGESAGDILCEDPTRLLTDESSVEFVLLRGGRVTPGVFREDKGSGQEAMRFRLSVTSAEVKSESEESEEERTGICYFDGLGCSAVGRV